MLRVVVVIVIVLPQTIVIIAVSVAEQQCSPPGPHEGPFQITEPSLQMVDKAFFQNSIHVMQFVTKCSFRFSLWPKGGEETR